MADEGGCWLTASCSACQTSLRRWPTFCWDFFSRTHRTLAAFDRTTLSSLWRFVVPDNSGTPSSLVSCGSGLLAFQTSDGKIFIINTATLPNQFLANLSLAESASPNPATPGAAVTFTTTVTNRGPARATGVVLTNALPAGTSLISLASSQGVCTNDGGTLVCTLGTLDAGASATMTFVVLPAAGGTVRAVSGVTFNEQDPDPSDNIATGVTYVQESRSDGIQTFQLATSDLVYDPFGKRLYLSVPAGTVGEGNSIMTLDPVTGRIGSPLPVGNGPDKLALSGDGQYLYVGLDLDSAVRRVRLDTQTPDLQFSIGNGLLVADMEVVPQNPAVVVVSRRHVARRRPFPFMQTSLLTRIPRRHFTPLEMKAAIFCFIDCWSTAVVCRFKARPQVSSRVSGSI